MDGDEERQVNVTTVLQEKRILVFQYTVGGSELTILYGILKKIPRGQDFTCPTSKKQERITVFNALM